MHKVGQKNGIIYRLNRSCQHWKESDKLKKKRATIRKRAKKCRDAYSSLNRNIPTNFRLKSFVDSEMCCSYFCLFVDQVPPLPVLWPKSVPTCGRGLPLMLAAFNEMYRTCMK